MVDSIVEELGGLTDSLFGKKRKAQSFEADSPEVIAEQKRSREEELRRKARNKKVFAEPPLSQTGATPTLSQLFAE